jgi:hypothetical protein
MACYAAKTRKPQPQRQQRCENECAEQLQRVAASQKWPPMIVALDALGRAGAAGNLDPVYQIS